MYDFVRQRTDLNHEKIILFGRSLGGAVALQLGKEKKRTLNTFLNFDVLFKAAYLSEASDSIPLHSVIVENTFTSIAGMAKRLFGVFLLDYIPNWCYKNVV